MLAQYLAFILDYLIAKIGLHVMDWSLRQVIEWLRDNPEAGKQCAEQSINRYMSEYDPDHDGFFWEREN